MKIIIISGGFDPIHSGHIAYINSAKKLGDRLIVALNSDNWLQQKKGKYFMPFYERETVLSNLRDVDEVIAFDDDDQGSCKNALIKIKDKYPNDELTFCNGGDRTNKNIPEMDIKGFNFLFGVGGENKANSSSDILKNWAYDSENRIWGNFYNLFTDRGVKVKELIINPGKGLSFQRHFHRSEIWYVSRGGCTVNYSEEEAEDYVVHEIKLFDMMHIKKRAWHQIINNNDSPCHIIEIQYGDKTEEDDIERLRYFENDKV
jgi:cytidyltransferase-like protein